MNYDECLKDVNLGAKVESTTEKGLYDVGKTGMYSGSVFVCTTSYSSCRG